MWTSQYVARSSDAHASYPVFVHRLARLLHASFRPRLQTSDLAAAIALAFCYPSPPSGWGRTLTSKLLSMPSTQLSRWRGGRYRVYSLKRRWSLEELTVERYDDVDVSGDTSSTSMNINN